MLLDHYRGRNIVIDEEKRDLDDAGRQKHYLSVTVNGAKQFSFRRDSDPQFVLAETQRYINAVDMAAERNTHRAAAGAYVPTRNADFADGWRAAA